MRKLIKNFGASFLVIVLLSIGMKAFSEANYFATPFGMYAYIAVVSLLVTLGLKWYLEYPISLLALVGVVYYYFPLDQPVSFNWLKQFINLVSNYLKDTQAASYLPESIAIILMGFFLFILIKLAITYHFWQYSFLFIVGYLLILLIVNQTELTQEIVMVVVLSFCLAAWQQLPAEPKLEHYGKLLVTLLVTVVLAYSAWHLPTWFPQTQAKVQTRSEPFRLNLRKIGFFDQFEVPRNGQFTSTGFSENDDVLGGPIYPNNDVVFNAIQKDSHYWKVDTKDIYTGKGWEDETVDRQRITTSPMLIEETTQDYLAESEEIELSLARSLSYLPKPDGKISWVVPEQLLETGQVEYSLTRNRVYLPLDKELKEITYDYSPPTYTVAQLAETIAVYDVTEEHAYLQLPDSHEQRVTVLAREKTMNADSDYAKVKAIENYLKYDLAFTYSMEKAEKVPANRDYVDHFLFDSQIGYCEQYSSAMVVMLRSIGIPTRWVKGFNGGKESERLEDGRQRFTITNADAHAWAEVYFSGIGWVPFEPTKSFVSSEQTRLNAQSGTSNEPAPVTPNAEATPTEASQSQSDSQKNTTEKKPAEVAKKPTNGAKRSFNFSLAQLFLGGALLLVVSTCLWLVRIRINWLWLIFKAKILPNYQFKAGFQSLVSLSEKIVQRSADETYRDYYERLQRTSHSPGPPCFVELLNTFEQQLYGNASSQVVSKEQLSQFKEVYQWLLRLKNEQKQGSSLK